MHRNRPRYYFAYGSNLHPERLGRRTPSRRLVGRAELPGHALRFHKRSVADDSAKADAYQTGHPRDRVLGAVYALDSKDFPALDAAESLGNGYDLRVQSLWVAGERLETFFYVAQPQHIDATSQPFDWYRELVLRGAHYHDFPAEYTAAIERVTSTEDPDPQRSAAHREILRAIHGH